MKLNGYRASHRNRLFLLTNKVLKIQEFLLFEYYLDAMDWDTAHEKNGVFEVFFEEIAPIFDRSIETIEGWHNILSDKGFIQLVDKKRNLYVIKSPARYQFDGRKGGKASEYFQNEKANPTIEFLLQNICFSPQISGKIPQNSNKPASTDKKALVSSKVESINTIPTVYKKVVDLKLKVRTPEEYQQISKESDFKVMTPEDMRLADEVSHELIVIESEKQAKKIVEEWFDGDWNKYEKACSMVPKEQIEKL